MKKHLLLIACALLTATVASAQKYVGGDLSVLLKYEEQKATYLDVDGKAIPDVLAFVKAQGWNTIRVRLFVDPSNDTDKNVCQDLDYVKRLGKRIKDAGLLFMLDFHYSDTWADPGAQTMPALFRSVNEPPQLYIYTYTKEALEALVAAGATPDLIQTGNEISFGMLWDDCKVEPNSAWSAYLDTHWDAFSTALKNAGKACREVCPRAQIIIHTEQCANNPTLDVAFFKRIKQYEVDYDIIGVSYYPYYKGPLANLDKGLTQLEKNFPDKQIQLVETGYPSKWAMGSYDYSKTYPLTHEGQRQYTADLIAVLQKHAQVNGLSWWYAEANAKGCTGSLATGWYSASLFDNDTGRALPALYELKSYVGNDTGVRGIEADGASRDARWYTVDGRQLGGEPTAHGVYIHEGRKIVVR